jgi:hypothetical protein
MHRQQLPATRAGRWARQAALRMLGVVSVLLLLALPRAQAVAAPVGHNPGNLGDRLGDRFGHGDDEGACEEIEPEELLECGAQYDDMLDMPLMLSLLRELDVRLTKAECDEFLASLWNDQVCVAGSIECGKMNAGAPPGPPPKFGSSSASASSSWPNRLGMTGTPSSSLVYAERTSTFESRDLQPPVPPPRRSGH